LTNLISVGRRSILSSSYPDLRECLGTCLLGKRPGPIPNSSKNIDAKSFLRKKIVQAGYETAKN